MTLSLLATILETTVLSLICFAAIIGNLSLFLIVYNKRSLRTITNMYILNLAVADILVSILSIPVTVVTIISKHWVFGHTACVALGYFTILSFIASVMSLGMIAIYRYFYIVKWNTSYANTFSKRKALLYGAAVWAVSISLASPPLFGWAEYRFIPGKSYCFVYWPSNVYYMYFMITVCFFGPLTTMVFSYYHILKATRDAKRKVAVASNTLALPPHRQGPTTSDETQNNDHPDIAEQHGNEDETPQLNIQEKSSTEINELDFKNVERPKMMRRIESKLDVKSKLRQFRVTREESRITNTFILVVALFVICWAPFAVTMFFDVYYPRPLSRAVDIISLLLGYLNSMCNPILYGVRNSAFKQGFLNLYSRFIPERFKTTNVAQPVNLQMNRITP